MILLGHHRRQAGYLLEVPVLLVLIIVGATFLLPQLSPAGRKILVALAALPVLICLFYMIVTPGWQPNSRGRLKPPWSVLAFLLLAAVIVAGVVTFVLG